MRDNKDKVENKLCRELNRHLGEHITQSVLFLKRERAPPQPNVTYSTVEGEQNPFPVIKCGAKWDRTSELKQKIWITSVNRFQHRQESSFFKHKKNNFCFIKINPFRIFFLSFAPISLLHLSVFVCKFTFLCFSSFFSFCSP